MPSLQRDVGDLSLAQYLLLHYDQMDKVRKYLDI